MITRRTALTLLSAGMAAALTNCGIPKANVACQNGFKNDTMGALSDAELMAAFRAAGKHIADGLAIKNALSCDPDIHQNPPPCIYYPPDQRALTVQPDCISVRGDHGPVGGGSGGEYQNGNIYISNIDASHQRVFNIAEYELETWILDHFDYDISDR